MCKLQRGQSVLEFAIILPFFFLLLLGLIYMGMIMADYLTLSSIARSSAREAAIASSKDYKNNYKNIRDRYKNVELPMKIFDWTATDRENFDIEYKNENNSRNVKVKMKANLNKSGSQLGYVVNKLAGGTSLAEIDITYTMYSEIKQE